MKTLRKTVSLLLLAVIFVTGNGFGFSIHSCLVSSDYSVSMLDKKCCCEKGSCHEEESESIEKDCCTYQYSYHKLQINSSIKSFEDAAIVQPVQHFISFVQFPQSDFSKASYCDADYGNPDALILFCRLLI